MPPPKKRASRSQPPRGRGSRKKTAAKRSPANESDDGNTAQRLQKILASAGVASRRECETLITDGRVMVDGETVTKLGTRADPATQEIAVDGQILKQPKHVYYAVHKPVGVVSTSWDPSGRTRLVDLAPHDKRLFCVGRLDRSSEGLALLTNDGDLAHRIMHPKFGVAKTYVVEVAGRFTADDARQLQEGVYLSEGKAKASTVRIKSKKSKSTLLEIELREGKNREIRRIMAKLEHKVLTLRRVAIGSLRLGDMPEGSYRDLTRAEVTALRRGSSEVASRPKPGKRKKPAGKPKAAAPVYDEPDSLEDDFDANNPGDDLIEVRTTGPASLNTGAVIGGDEPLVPERKSAKKTSRRTGTGKKTARKKSARSSDSRGKGRAAKTSAKRKSTKRPAKKKARSGKPPRKRKR